MKTLSSNRNKLSKALFFSAFLISYSFASSTFPQYKITPSSVDTTDSVSLFIAKGMFQTSCAPVYLTSFTITQEPVVCKEGCPTRYYRVTIVYDSAARWIDSLIKSENYPAGFLPQSIWQYNYNNDTVFYFYMQCCDAFNCLYSKNGVYLCAPNGGFSGGGDGKCPDFLSKATDKKLVWEDKRTRPIQSQVCGQVLTEYGPRFDFGKLRTGTYFLYDNRDSSKMLLQFSVPGKSTGIIKQNSDNAQKHPENGFSAKFKDGTLAFSIDKAQNMFFSVYRLNGEILFASDRQLLPSGNHRIHFESLHFKDKVFIVRFNGDSWSKTIRVNMEKN
jgi:hypothetical protein